jgi:phosphoenolpyruvate carboxykinase (ATP)
VVSSKFIVFTAGVLQLTSYLRPSREHTELEEELHTTAHIDYDRVAIVANPSVSALYEDALVYETGSAITSSGALTAYSGSKTGRSPLDKRVVKEEGSEKDVWWGPVNKPMSPEVSDCFPLLAVVFQKPLSMNDD